MHILSAHMISHCHSVSW